MNKKEVLLLGLLCLVALLGTFFTNMPEEEEGGRPTIQQAIKYTPPSIFLEEDILPTRTFSPVKKLEDKQLSVLMLEARCDTRIEFVLSNVLKIFHRNQTNVATLVHSEANATFIRHRPTITLLRKSNRLKLWNFIGTSGGGVHYSKIFFSLEFWLAIPTSHILIVQTDSWICSPGPHIYVRLLDYASQYDFIGSPDSPVHFNGGFSLRSRSAMINSLLRFRPAVGYHAEDVFFSRAIQLLNAEPSSPQNTWQAWSKNFTFTLLAQMENLNLKDGRRDPEWSPLAIKKAQRLPILPLKSMRIPAYEVALSFSLRATASAQDDCYSRWRKNGTRPLPIGFHRGESYNNPLPSSSFRKHCHGIEVVLSPALLVCTSV